MYFLDYLDAADCCRWALALNISQEFGITARLEPLAARPDDAAKSSP
jgi:hypothetical protein